MAKVSVTIVNKLKESYIKLLNKKYRNVIKDINDNIDNKKCNIRKQVCDDVINYINTNYPDIVVTNNTHSYYYEIKIGIDPNNIEIGELKKQIDEYNSVLNIKTDELDLWEIEALKAGLEENIPEFNV
jgi:hypothetical protein